MIDRLRIEKHINVHVKFVVQKIPIEFAEMS